MINEHWSSYSCSVQLFSLFYLRNKKRKNIQLLFHSTCPEVILNLPDLKISVELLCLQSNLSFKGEFPACLLWALFHPLSFSGGDWNRCYGDHFSTLTRKQTWPRELWAACSACTQRFCHVLPRSPSFIFLVVRCRPPATRPWHLKQPAWELFRIRTLHFIFWNSSAPLNPSLESEREVRARCLEDGVHLFLYSGKHYVPR